MKKRLDQKRPPQIRTSQEWCAYFAWNAKTLMHIPWEKGAALSAEERGAIVASVQGFQRGESSEGGYLYRCAKIHAAQTDDPDYVEAIGCFIKEEQRHAAELAKFMTLVDIPLIKKTWPDTVFRKLRHLGDLEVSISVLVTAEIIAKVYYAALREATASPVLRRLCNQILQDEVAHVEFQTERLAILRKNRSTWALRLTHGLHRFLFFGTCFVVWQKHGRAMKKGGFGFRRFWKVAWRELNDAVIMMDPQVHCQINFDVSPRKTIC